MKRVISLFMCTVLLLNMLVISVFASGVEDNESDLNIGGSVIDVDGPEVSAKSALLMDADTGTVLYTKNASEALPPASVTKIMTLLLVAEALDDGLITADQKVMISANAASMGGSQIFLSEGEEFTVDELLKSTVIASANDAAVALAELICGNEGAFAERMNERASELGMKNTVFENATGLDDTVTNHVTSAYDIALMSRELIKHDSVTKYSNIWQDSIRDGEFVLTNTNRLVRYYDGCTGLKTGSTDKAGFCVSATAKRDGMHLIAVIMGSESREERNNAARALLDYGFSNYALYKDAECELERIPVLCGKKDEISVYSEHFSRLISKSDKNKVEKFYNLPEALTAPLKCGDVVGEIVYKIGETELGKTNVVIREDVERVKVWDLFGRILRCILIGK